MPGRFLGNDAAVGFETRTATPTVDRVEIRVLTSEDVSVPYGAFQDAQKVKVTYYSDGEVDDDVVLVYQWEDQEVGLVKEMEVDPGFEIGIELTLIIHQGRRSGEERPRSRGISRRMSCSVVARRARHACWQRGTRQRCNAPARAPSQQQGDLSMEVQQ